MRFNEIISELENVANNPKAMLNKYLNENKKVIGLLPVYTPGEIVHAAGLVPMGIWGGNTDIKLAKEYFPAFACSIMQAIDEYALRGEYDGISAVIIPCMCDTLITMTQNWKAGVKNIPMIPFVHPQNRMIEAGVKYLMSEYEHVKEEIEKIAGTTITDEKLQASIDLYNENRKALQEFVELTVTHLNTVTPYVRSVVIKSGHFMLKEDHTKLVVELNGLLKAMPEEDFKGKKILATGIIFDNPEVLKMLEEANIAIAYDNMANETRQFATLVPDKGNTAIEKLARQWQEIRGCTLAYDPKKERGQMIIDEVNRLGLDGVFYVLMKFCDPEEYDYPIVKKELEKANIPHLYLEIEQGSLNIGQIQTRVQTFVDILN